MLNHCKGYENFQDIEHELQEIILRHYLEYSFL